MTTPPLITHMEAQFGRILRGWTPSEWVDPAIQVVEFNNGSVPDVSVCSTLGVSDFELQSPVSPKRIRQELFFMFRPSQFDSRLPAVLDQIAREAVRNDRAVVRGSVVEKLGLILPGRAFTAIYPTLPIYYPKGFWTLDASERGIAMCWLLLITDAERRHVQDHGWTTFETLLDSASFDLFDLDRPSLV